MPSSRTRPVPAASSSASSAASSLTPAARTRVSRSNWRPMAAAVRSRRPRLIGQSPEPARQHVGNPRRQVRIRNGSASTPRSAASRAYSTRKNGLPSVRSRSASASRGLGRLSRHTLDHGRRLLGGEPAEREPQSMAAGQHLDQIGQRTGRCGMGPPGGQHEQGRPGRYSRRAAGALAASPDPPSADRRGRPGRVARAPHPNTAWMICSQTANWLTSCSSSPSPGRPRPSPRSTDDHGHSGGAPSSCEQRPVSTRISRSRCVLDQLQGRAGSCRSPVRRSGWRTAVRRFRAAVSSVAEGGELGVPTDQRRHGSMNRFGSPGRPRPPAAGPPRPGPRSRAQRRRPDPDRPHPDRPLPDRPSPTGP